MLPDVGLEQTGCLDQFWIGRDARMTLAAIIYLSLVGFNDRRFYIDRFSSEGAAEQIRTHMRSLSESRLKMNLPDHRIQAKMEMETPRSSKSIHHPMLTRKCFQVKDIMTTEDLQHTLSFRNSEKLIS
ncbi:hypothetical protein Tco_1157035 [Tanacetum coccineum]